ncbi:MAG TPA: DNA ligase D [Rudaea sp.]
MSLIRYRQKRDFGKTREPAPEAAAAPGRARFVVQLHHATARHYDFRLQVGGVLKSWAVPKGPSFDPKAKRLAVETEDHPLAYAEFEGDIPQGQYGGGNVRRFDIGTWSTDDDPAAQLKKGHLRFQLHGTKLRGGWNLVRTRKVGKQQQWLLIKQDDAYAGDVEADDLVDAPAATKPAQKTPAKTPKKTAIKTAAKKSRTHPALAPSDLLAYAGAKRGACPREAWAPELARLVDGAPEGERWLHEVKWDGYRLLAIRRAGKVTLWSRNALSWTDRLPDMADAIAQLPGGDLACDGELVSTDGARSDFDQLQATLSEGAPGKLRYVIFDLVHFDGVDLREVALIDRKRILQQLLAGGPAELVYSEHHVGDGARVFDNAVRQKLEGIVSKRIDSPYRAGRGGDWCKVKRTQSDEFVVIGWTAPRGSRTHVGSLLLAAPQDDGTLRYVGRVGSGFSDTQLHELGRLLPPLERSTPAADAPRAGHPRWTEPHLVVEVDYRAITRAGILRQASLHGLREDKTMKDLRASAKATPKKKTAAAASTERAATKRAAATRATAKRPTAKPAAAKTVPAKRTAAKRGAAKPPGRNPDSHAAFRITHPERIVYPDSAITKGDVAAYYATVAKWLLREAARRPLSLVRCPRGATQACFFQKHIERGFGPHVHSAPIVENSGETAEYVYIDDEAGLMNLAQMNTIELHAWGARVDDPDRCDRIVFDLDPGEGVAWRRVCEGARMLRDLLARLGLRTFLRTSGGKGLHVVVPLAPAAAWEPVRAFAEAITRLVAAQEPDRYVAVSGEKNRKDRIFVDYLRNGRGATSVTNYSLRARPGAPVALPISWDELARVRAGNAFTLRNVPARLKRRAADPWADIDRVRQSLPKTSKIPRA